MSARIPGYSGKQQFHVSLGKQQYTVPPNNKVLIQSRPGRICRELRRKRLVDAAMRKHGLKSASKRARALAAAEEEADETLEFLDSRVSLGERHVRGGDLAVHLKQRADKEARLAKVLEGAQWLPFAVTRNSRRQSIRTFTRPSDDVSHASTYCSDALALHSARQRFSRRG